MSLILRERPTEIGEPAGYPHTVPSADLRVVDDLESSFARGDDSALEAAYDEHGSLVYSFCRRSLGDERAKDVTQGSS